MHERMNWKVPTLLPPGTVPDLKTWPTTVDAALTGGKKEGEKRLHDLCAELAHWQRILYAQREQALLVILQGMDTSGKDGTIRHVFRLVNPNGVHVAAFSRPTRLELSHDYLWRIHQRAPARGEIVIFDRSHYEDIVTVRVNDLRPSTVWKRRYKHVNAFEEMLSDEGVTIVKFFLHIDRAEQKKRLEARLRDPEKHWKFDPSDLVARQRWDAYMDAYPEVLSRCNFSHAPWHIIPANKKWVRNILVAQVLVETMRKLGMTFPKAHMDLARVNID